MMTVADLIACLAQLPGDLPVVTEVHDDDGYSFIGYDPVDGVSVVDGYRAPASMPFTIGDAKRPPSSLILEADEPFPCVLLERWLVAT